jgi:hypothetical protein
MLAADHRSIMRCHGRAVPTLGDCVRLLLPEPGEPEAEVAHDRQGPLATGCSSADTTMLPPACRRDRTGVPEFIEVEQSVVDEASRRRATPSHEDLRRPRRLQLTSVITVPLRTKRGSSAMHVSGVAVDHDDLAGPGRRRTDRRRWLGEQHRLISSTLQSACCRRGCRRSRHRCRRALLGGRPGERCRMSSPPTTGAGA